MCGAGALARESLVAGSTGGASGQLAGSNYWLGTVSDTDCGDSGGWRDRDHRHDSQASGADREDRARHRSRRTVAAAEVEGAQRFSLMLGVNVIGAEHWVGGTPEFAHSGVSKTHTC